MPENFIPQLLQGLDEWHTAKEADADYSLTKKKNRVVSKYANSLKLTILCEEGFEQLASR